MTNKRICQENRNIKLNYFSMLYVTFSLILFPYNILSQKLLKLYGMDLIWGKSSKFCILPHPWLRQKQYAKDSPSYGEHPPIYPILNIHFHIYTQDPYTFYTHKYMHIHAWKFVCTAYGYECVITLYSRVVPLALFTIYNSRLCPICINSLGFLKVVIPWPYHN